MSKNLLFDLDILKKRARVISQIRSFFDQHNVLEVETPLLWPFATVDSHIDPIIANQRFYLQTSPELSMKKLICLGSGSLYQISKAFRNLELGRWHNPEFTIIEWYRMGFNYFQLMDEVESLIQSIQNWPRFTKKTYTEIFTNCVGLHPMNSGLDEIKKYAKSLNVPALDENDKDAWLDYIFMDKIQPGLGQETPVFIYDFPSTQANLAKLALDDSQIALRFELFYKGVELCNGFEEAEDATEYLNRFEKENLKRKMIGKPAINIDKEFITLLNNKKLPMCSGVALGFDRLLMLMLDKTSLQEVLPFPLEG